MDKYDRKTDPEIGSETRDKAIILSEKYPKKEKRRIEVNKGGDYVGISFWEFAIGKYKIEVYDRCENTSFIFSSEIFRIGPVEDDRFIFEKYFRFEVPSSDCIFSECRM
jgi:hypothetical protein